MKEVIWNIFRYLYISAMFFTAARIPSPPLSIHPKPKLQLVVTPKSKPGHRHMARIYVLCWMCVFRVRLAGRERDGWIENGKGAWNRKRRLVDGPHLSTRGFKENLCT